MVTLSSKPDPVDVAISAIETELEAALLTSAVVHRILYYTPRPEHFDRVTVRIRLWAIRHDFRVEEFADDLQEWFAVTAANGLQIVKVHTPLVMREIDAPKVVVEMPIDGAFDLGGES